ncbi:MAG: PQQ-binding-like beta-propeller repeat protein [Bacteroidia bacterium]|nr:PQQ-binding-like beta-propeller repeat protein [Bacteroidia bacterium]
MKRTIVSFSLLAWLAPVCAQQLATKWQLITDSISAFGSPVAQDLNFDGVKDIVLGCGLELSPSQYGVLAVDGASGDLLWHFPASSQVFTQPLFLDLTGDGIAEVLIGGRNAQFWAINGATGQLVWEFFPSGQGNPADSGWYNFYSPQWLPDLTGDSLPEILISNGGDATATIADTLRSEGSLLVLDVSDGSIVARDTMPDGKETYFSPLLIPSSDPLDPWILFGSGGEVVHGSLWKSKLSWLLTDQLELALPLLSGKGKGFVSAASLADLSGDGVEDVIVSRHNGGVVAYDWAGDRQLWEVTYPGHEPYVSPSIGQFTGSSTPDVLVYMQQGAWPIYFGGFFVLIDGATGQVVWTRTTETYQFASPNALDSDLDGFDEILFVHNFYEDRPGPVRVFRHAVELYDFQSDQTQVLSPIRDGMDVFSTALLTDLDQNGRLDFVYAANNNTEGWYQSDGITLSRTELSGVGTNVAWGGYLGNAGNGRYELRLISDVGDIHSLEVKVFPNPATQEMWVHTDPFWQDGSIELLDLTGRLVRSTKESHINLEGVADGTYLYRINLTGKTATGKVIIRR